MGYIVGYNIVGYKLGNSCTKVMDSPGCATFEGKLNSCWWPCLTRLVLMGSQPRSSMCGDFYRAFSDRDYYRSLSIQGQHSRLFRNRETFTTIGAYQFKVNSSLKISDLLRRPAKSADNMPIFLHIGISPSISTKFATICMVMFQFVLIKNTRMVWTCEGFSFR